MASLRDKVAEVAARIGANPEDLWQVIQYESQGNPKAVGPKPKSGKPGVGILQFMESTAKNLGTTQEALLKMTAEQQLPYVEKYFSDVKRRHKIDKFNFRQLYASVMAGTPHAGLDYGDGYNTIGKAIKTMEGRKKSEGVGDKPVVEDVLGKLYGGAGEKKEDPYVPGHGPLKPELAKQKEKEIQHKQTPLAPERPWHDRLQFDEGNIAEKTVEQAKDMGMKVGGAEAEVPEDLMERATKATWEILHPGEPMPEGWSVQGEIGKIQLKKAEEGGQAVKPGDWAKKYVGGEVKPGDWAKKYVGQD